MKEEIQNVLIALFVVAGIVAITVTISLTLYYNAENKSEADLCRDDCVFYLGTSHDTEKELACNISCNEKCSSDRGSSIPNKTPWWETL